MPPKRKSRKGIIRKQLSTGGLDKALKFHGAEELDLLPREDRVPVQNGNLVQNVAIRKRKSRKGIIRKQLSTGGLDKALKFHGAEELDLLPREDRVPVQNGNLVQNVAIRKRKSRKGIIRKQLSTGGLDKALKFHGAEELDLLPREDRVPVQNGNLVQNVAICQVPLKETNVENQESVQTADKTKNKIINPKHSDMHVKHMDHSLMNEHLRKPMLTAMEHDKNTTPATDNNNDTDLSDQNDSARLEKSPNKKSNVNKERNTGKSTKNKDVIIDFISPNSTGTIEKTKQRPSNISLEKVKRILAQEILVKVKVPKKRQEVYLQCDHCDMMFGSKITIKRHMLIHLNLRPYSCQYCEKKFRVSCHLRTHMSKTHPKEFAKARYHCRICKKPFQMKGQLTLHQKFHLKKKEKLYNCAFCEKIFKSKPVLLQHEKRHMAPGRYKCSMCSMSYDSRPMYSDHLKTHDGQKNYTCQHCGKHYLRPSSIARHIRVSHGGIRMQCPICNKLLRGHLTEHMRTHENHRPHACDICGQKFTQSTQLTVHKRSHTGARPYPCRICKQPFSHSNALMLHIRRHTGEKPFACAMCPQTFSQLPHMKAHMRSIHSKTEFYKCNKCKTFFKLKATLEAHSEQCGGANIKKEKTKDSTVSEISRLRFLIALLFTMIASKEKLYDLGFNKRLIDDILEDSIEAMGMVPCKDTSEHTLSRLKINALMLLQGTVPKHQMALFIKENKTTEEILELLTDDSDKKK